MGKMKATFCIHAFSPNASVKNSALRSKYTDIFSVKNISFHFPPYKTLF